MKPKALLLFFSITFVFAVTGAAQNRSSRPMPILVDMIGSSKRPAAAPRGIAPRRNIGETAPAGATYGMERRLFELLNDARAEHGLGPIVWDESVAGLARMHSRSMAENGFFSHRGMDGQTVDGRAFDHGIGDWRGIGENIATMKGHKDPGTVALQNWMRSPSHRQNILSGRWNRSAVGIAVSEDGTYYLTQVFMIR